MAKSNDKAPKGTDPRGSTPPAAPAPAPAAKPPAGDDDVKPRKRKEEMVSMTVHSAFRIQHDDGSFTEYGLGTQDLPRSHSEHWYTKYHADRNDD